MAWTVNGVPVSDNGWIFPAANNLVPKRKKYANGTKHGGPCGYKLRPARVKSRAFAKMVEGYRSRRRNAS